MFSADAVGAISGVVGAALELVMTSVSTFAEALAAVTVAGLALFVAVEATVDPLVWVCAESAVAGGADVSEAGLLGNEL